MSLRLLIINVALNWGSTGKIVEGIGSLAMSEGWEVYVAHGARYVNKSSLKHFQITSKIGEIIHYVESSLFDAQGRGSRFKTKRFLKVIEEIGPDLVHIHNIHGCFLNYPILFQFLQEKSIPVVWTLHDCWAMTGHCVHFERSRCEKWKVQCSKCPQKHDFPTSFLLDRSRSNYIVKKRLFTAIDKMRVTTVSAWLKSVAEQSFLQKFPIDVVPNGIDLSTFKYCERGIRNRYGIGNKKLLLAVASGFDERKGINDYCALCKVLPDDYQLLLIGVSEIESRSLPDNVIAFPRADSVEELTAFYSAADVLLSLSYEETFGLTIIEAMACGTPAIVYDNTAQPELITPETGRVVPTGNIEVLKNTIMEVCSFHKSVFFSECRKRAALFDERVTYQKYLVLYEEMLIKTS